MYVSPYDSLSNPVAHGRHSIKTLWNELNYNKNLISGVLNAYALIKRHSKGIGANTSKEGELFSSEDMGVTGKERQKHFLIMTRKKSKW